MFINGMCKIKKKKYVRTFCILAVLLAASVLNGCASGSFSRDESDSEVTVSVPIPQTESDSETLPEPEPEPESEKGKLDGIVIVLDPGHGTFEKNFQEPISPGSDQTKKAFSTGTAGKYMSEADLVLKLALMLRPMLEADGAEVYMTREDGVSISNVERAEFANRLGADLAFRIHANGTEDPEAHGISMQIPAAGTIGEDLESKSRCAGETIHSAMIEATGAFNRGIRERSDLAGFNWSTVPVVLVEVGFMSNPEEDELLSFESYQQLLADGMYNGIIDYFNENPKGES